MSKDLVGQFDRAEEIAEKYLKGQSPTSIAKELGTTRAKVLENLAEWGKFVTQDSDIKSRGKELLLQIDQHYGMLIREAWWVIEEAKANGDLKEMTAALKAAAQIEKDRTTVFQTAGITAEDELAEQLANMEIQHEGIKQLLKETVSDCPRCRGPVFSGLAKMSGKPEVVVVQEEPS